MWNWQEIEIMENEDPFWGNPVVRVVYGIFMIICLIGFIKQLVAPERKGAEKKQQQKQVEEIVIPDIPEE